LAEKADWFWKFPWCSWVGFEDPSKSDSREGEIQSLMDKTRGFLAVLRQRTSFEQYRFFLMFSDREIIVLAFDRLHVSSDKAVTL
jgi:hypothetical protein